MSKESIERTKAMADDPNMISGIHNYCDKWCERCSFTSRCAVFAMGEEDGLDARAVAEAEELAGRTGWTVWTGWTEWTGGCCV